MVQAIFSGTFLYELKSCKLNMMPVTYYGCMFLCMDIGVNDDFVKDYGKPMMAKSIGNQGHAASIESRSVIHTGAHRPGGIIPETVNKSVEGVGVLHRMERAAVTPAIDSLKFNRHDPLVAVTNSSESRGKLNREKLLVAPLAVNMSGAQIAHG